MEERFKKIDKERDELTRRFSKGIRDIRRKGDLKNLVLEKRLEQLTEGLVEKQNQLNEVIKSGKLTDEVAVSVMRKLEEVLISKNRAIKDLQYQVHLCSKIYNDTIRVYSKHMERLRIPLEEVQFELIPTVTSTMPVPGLVVKALV